MPAFPRCTAFVALLVLLGVGLFLWLRQAPAPAGNERRPSFGAGEAHVPETMPQSVNAGMASVASTAPDTAFTRCHVAWRRTQEPRLQALRERTDPDSMLTHALLAGVVHPQAASGPSKTGSMSTWLASAAAAAPDDPEIAWFHMLHCAESEGCDRKAALERFLAMEPDNLAGWMFAMSDVQRDDDAAEQRAAFEGASRASYYDARDGDGFVRRFDALRDAPLPAECVGAGVEAAWKATAARDIPLTPEHMALVPVIAVIAAELRPYAALRDACRRGDDQPMPQERVVACRAIMEKVAGGRTLIDQVIGTGLMTELSRGTQDHASWQERMRGLRWLQQRQMELPFDAEALAQRWSGDEVAVTKRQLADVGLWPPPPDWHPEAL